MMQSFWKSQARWPNDPAGYVFLARAIDLIGKAFVEGWTGKEFATIELSNQIPPHRPRVGFPRQTPEIEALTARFRTSKEPQEANAPLPNQVRFVRDRAAEARQTTALLCESQALRTFGRPVEGGSLHAIDPRWWRTERLEPRFTWCQLNPNDPFGYAIGGDRFWLIFVEKDSLETVIANHAASLRAEEGQPKKRKTTSRNKTRWNGCLPTEQRRGPMESLGQHSRQILRSLTKRLEAYHATRSQNFERPTEAITCLSHKGALRDLSRTE
jgi:hypothetical protein